MPGVPGRSGGQNRKRSEHRLGRPNYAEGDPRHHDNVDRPNAKSPAVQPELVLPDGQAPLPVIADIWKSLATSGFDEFYTDADWQAARVLLFGLQQIVVEMVNKGGTSALKMAEMRSILADLMVTEAARRRLRIEVQRGDGAERPEPDNVSHLDLARDIA